VVDRREFLAVSTAAIFGSRLVHERDLGEAERMYGIIGKIVAVEGRRDELADILIEGVAAMPGCLSYVVAEDRESDDALWVTEVWDTEASHEASLSLPSVQEAIRKGRPLIAGFEERIVTEPLGGYGLESGGSG
jgi:quinol monooxygenase YgiN